MHKIWEHQYNSLSSYKPLKYCKLQPLLPQKVAAFCSKNKIFCLNWVKMNWMRQFHAYFVKFCSNQLVNCKNGIINLYYALFLLSTWIFEKLSVGPKNAAKNNLCSISKDENIVIHKVDICGFLKTPTEICYVRGYTWTPLGSYTSFLQLVKIPVIYQSYLPIFQRFEFFI